MSGAITDSTFLPFKGVCQPSLHTKLQTTHRTFMNCLASTTAQWFTRLQDLEQFHFHRKTLKIWI